MKYLKTIILIIASFFLVNSSYAQGWQKIISDSIGLYDASLLQADNGDFIVSGSRGLSSDGNKYIIRITNDGETLWLKIHNPNTSTNFNWHSQISKTTGGYILCGTIAGSNAPDTILLVKIDEEADVVWSKKHAEPDLSTVKFSGTSAGGCILTSIIDDELMAVWKTDADGNIEWRKEHNAPGYATPIETSTGNYFLSGEWYTRMLDQNGDLLWDTGGTLYNGIPVEAQDGGFFLLDPFFEKRDVDGNQLWTSTGAKGVVEAPNGHIFGIGTSTDSKMTLREYDPYGNVLKTQDYSAGLVSNGSRIIIAADNSIVCLGSILGLPNAPVTDLILVKTNDVAPSYNNLLQGNIYEDRNADCLLDTGDISRDIHMVKIEGNGILQYVTPYTDGSYNVLLEEGDYKVSLILQNDLWAACASDILVEIEEGDSTTLDLLFNKQTDCSLMEVDVSAPFVRRCFDTDYFVQYCNKGTAIAEDAYVEVTLDPYLSYLSSSIPLSSQTGNLLRFDLGDVLYGDCGNFSIKTFLDCDSTILGQTHCVTAHILPDSPCNLDPAWNGADIKVEAECVGDSINFYLNNVGTGDMLSPENYVVTEDVIMFQSGTYQLNSGESLKVSVPSTGATFRLVTEQVPNHPYGGHPSKVVEGCVPSGQSFNVGFATIFGEDDGHPAYSMDCQENIGAFDPNDKRGYPKGYGAENYIETYDDIEYHIRFQNTGTDTAFTVKIRDSLSVFLDPASVIPGASSHPYDFQIDGTGQLLFTFNDILLVDSFANEPASHGFVKFRVRQQADNPIGTVIENKAGIFFDFNPPVITNMTTHTIGEPLLPAENEAELAVNLTVFLEGALVDPNNINNFLSHMRSDLNTTHGILPGQTPNNGASFASPAGQPYKQLPWNYQGTEGETWTDTDYENIFIEHGNAVVDWILVSFRSDLSPESTVARAAAVLLQNGQLVFPDGSDLAASTTGPLYVLIEHRNHMGILSPQPVSIVDGALTFDFTKINSYQGPSSLGQGQKVTIDGRYMLFASDCNQAADVVSYDINALDKLIWTTLNGNFGQYLNADFDMNGDVNGEDYILWSRNNGISSRVEK